MIRRIGLASVIAASTLALSAFTFTPGAHATVRSHVINGQDVTTTTHWVGSSTEIGFSCGIISPYTDAGYYSGPDNFFFDLIGFDQVAGSSVELDTPTEAILSCTVQTSEHPSHNLFVTSTTGCGTNYGDSSFQYITENRAGLITLRCYAYAPNP